MSSEERKNRVLSAIIDLFVQTAQPVGSKSLILSYNFKVSPATIRNDMAALEESGLIMQPHTSAGRVPTDSGYRLYVDQLADFESAQNLAQNTLKNLLRTQSLNRASRKVYEAVSLLSQASPNLAFATIPENDQTFYMGFSKMLRQPEFMESPMQASQVIEVIEEGKSFLKGLKNLDLGEQARILIGEENILSGIESCSMILASYEADGHHGVIGILGPKRMPYAFNAALINEVTKMLKHDLF